VEGEVWEEVEVGGWEEEDLEEVEEAMGWAEDPPADQLVPQHPGHLLYRPGPLCSPGMTPVPRPLGGQAAKAVEAVAVEVAEWEEWEECLLASPQLCPPPE